MLKIEFADSTRGLKMRRLALYCAALAITACGSAPTAPTTTVTPEQDGTEVAVMGQARQDGATAVLVTDSGPVEVDRLRWPAEVVGTTVQVRGVLQRLRMPPAIAAAPPKQLPSGETTPTVQESYEGLWRSRLSDAKWYPLQETPDAG